MLKISAKSEQLLPLGLKGLSGWMVTCVHNPVGGRGANQILPLPPRAKSGQNTARDHRPLSVYTVMLII
jgi:hypothetical protein